MLLACALLIMEVSLGTNYEIGQITERNQQRVSWEQARRIRIRISFNACFARFPRSKKQCLHKSMRMNILRSIHLTWCRKCRDQRDWPVTDRCFGWIHSFVWIYARGNYQNLWASGIERYRRANLRIRRERMVYVYVREGSRHLVYIACCCSVLQCVAICCSVLKYVAVCGKTHRDGQSNQHIRKTWYVFLCDRI